MHINLNYKEMNYLKHTHFTFLLVILHRMLLSGAKM